MEHLQAFNKNMDGTFKPPNIPNTPSKTINEMLQTRCGRPQNNILKAALSYYICCVFLAITSLYNAINPDKSRHSHSFWMICCGTVSAVIVLKAYLLYNIVMATAFVFHALLYYGAILLGLCGAGLGVSGAIFFDKEGASSSAQKNASKYTADVTGTKYN